MEIESKLPTGDVTFLLTDIEGSTQRWEKNPGAMDSAVKQHDEIIIKVAESLGGFDLRKKGEGDSHFVVFDSATKAALAAISIQRAIDSLQFEGAPVRIRIAIHTGSAELRNHDYFGQAVNRCARLRGVAHGGQIILSETTKRLVVGKLPSEAALQDLGTHRLKDLLQPERVFQLNVEGRNHSFPPLNSLRAANHNLPVQLTSFVGRTEQLATIKDLIYSHSLVSLLGAGGTGKTRLAVQIAAEIVEDFPDGVWFVPLVGLQDPSLVAQAVAESLPISLKGREPLDAISESYGAARALFVIDNCEHLDSGPAEFIDGLLRKCPQIVVLATSREPLGVAGENAYLVPAMDCDLHGKTPDPDHVAKLEAVQLFRERARSRRSNEDVLNADTAEDIALLCKRLDGIPLALEQAAANLSHMTPSEILERLNKHFKMLEIDEIGIEDRHKTMEATIDWSYSRLKPLEKHLFEQLSIFVGGWTRDAVEFVCGDEVVPADKVATQLEKLVKRSLVVSDRPSGSKISRYRMLEPIREYSAATIGAETSGLRAKHFEWFCNLLSQAQAAGLNADNGRFLRRLEMDLDNIRYALDWGISIDGDAVHTLEACVNLYRFWYQQGLFREGTTWLQRALDAAISAPESLRAEGLISLGILVTLMGNSEAAVNAITSAKEIWEGLGDESGVARAQGNLANVAFMNGDFSEAATQLKKSADFFRGQGNDQLLAPTLENLGVAESELGNLDLAETVLKEAVAIRRKQKNKPSLAKALDSLLGIYAKLNVLKSQMSLFSEAAELALESSDDFAIENLIEVGVHLAIEQGEFTLAAKGLGGMEVVLERTGRVTSKTQGDLRIRLEQKVRGNISQKDFGKAFREGRASGSHSVLALIRDSLEDSP